MNFLDYIMALDKWEERRISERRFPFLTTFKYILLVTMISWVLYVAYITGYRFGHLDSMTETLNKKLENSK